MADEAKPMPDDERLLVQRQIASILDFPSVYMGGPSRSAMDRAARVIACLERGERLFSTLCVHHGWMTYKAHGVYCPDCGTKLGDTQAEVEERVLGGAP